VSAAQELKVFCFFSSENFAPVLWPTLFNENGPIAYGIEPEHFKSPFSFWKRLFSVALEQYHPGWRRPGDKIAR